MSTNLSRDAQILQDRLRETERQLQEAIAQNEKHEENIADLERQLADARSPVWGTESEAK